MTQNTQQPNTETVIEFGDDAFRKNLKRIYLDSDGGQVFCIDDEKRLSEKFPDRADLPETGVPVERYRSMFEDYGHEYPDLKMFVVWARSGFLSRNETGKPGDRVGMYESFVIGTDEYVRNHCTEFFYEEKDWDLKFITAHRLNEDGSLDNESVISIGIDPINEIV